jgi:hypothetical protein
MKITELRALLDSGKFHHATYRDIGTLWEGLRIYESSSHAHAFRGFIPSGWFAKNDPNLKEAQRLVAHSGVSVGSYGNG